MPVARFVQTPCMIGMRKKRRVAPRAARPSPPPQERKESEADPGPVLRWERAAWSWKPGPAQKAANTSPEWGVKFNCTPGLQGGLIPSENEPQGLVGACASPRLDSNRQHTMTKDQKPRSTRPWTGAPSARPACMDVTARTVPYNLNVPPQPSGIPEDRSHTLGGSQYREFARRQQRRRCATKLCGGRSTKTQCKP